MTFEFNNQLLPQSLVEIDNIGEFAIEAHNDNDIYWYMIIRSSMGTTSIATCGPIIPDVNLLPTGFKETLDRMPWKEDKIQKTIELFLNDKKKALTEAKIVDIADAINQFPNMQDYLSNYSDEVY